MGMAEDVLAVLLHRRFFELLDDRLCPADESAVIQPRGADYWISKSILNELRFPAEDVEDVLAVFAERGACCDCEILFNFAGDNRLKARYWQERAHGYDSRLRKQMADSS